jgi:hypothetical protein
MIITNGEVETINRVGIKWEQNADKAFEYLELK